MLDLRRNEIRKLTNDSFTKYPSVKELYLTRNHIKSVEAAAFHPLGSLEILDMKQNKLRAVPPGLPATLIRLSLSSNPIEDNVDMGRGLREAVGLRVLHMRLCGLNRFPRTGLLPSLVELDLADNPIDEVTPLDLARLCRLNKLNMTGTPVMFRYQQSDGCRCRQLKQWADTYGVLIDGLDCQHFTDEPSACPVIPDDEARAVHEQCMSEWRHGNIPYWTIGGCVLLVVVAVLFVLYYSIVLASQKSPGQHSSRTEQCRRRTLFGQQ